jgi:uncharacterized protein (TIGR03086 family)
MLDSVHQALAYAGGVVGGIGDDQRRLPTPCEGFDVEQLCAHLVQKVVFFGGIPAGGPHDPEAVPDPDLTGRPLSEPFDEAADRVRSTWDAERLDEVFDLAPGRLSGTELARYFLLELLGHGWDLAVATHQPADPGAELANAGLAAAEQIGDEALRTPGLMAPAVTVPATAPAMDRFVAYIGRDPHRW